MSDPLATSCTNGSSKGQLSIEGEDRERLQAADLGKSQGAVTGVPGDGRQAEDRPSASSALQVQREPPGSHLPDPGMLTQPLVPQSSLAFQNLPPTPSDPSRGSRRAHVDDGVCLDIVHVRVPQPQLFAAALGGADDAGGDCVLKGKRASDGDHELPRPQLGGAAKQ